MKAQWYGNKNHRRVSRFDHGHENLIPYSEEEVRTTYEE